MKAISFILPVLYIFVLFGCKKESAILEKPKAEFSFTIEKNRAPASVSFTNNSAGCTQYAWDFGDGTKSSEELPEHIYTEAGEYNVTLTGTGKSGTNKSSRIVKIESGYSKVQINSLMINSIPFTNPAGLNWDDGDGPDVYIDFLDSANNIVLSGFESVNNNSDEQDLPFGWYLFQAFRIDDLDQKFTISIMDKDGSMPPEEIGSLNFGMRQYAKLPNPYPGSIVLANGKTRITLEFQWID